MALVVEQCRLSDAMQAPCHELEGLIFQNPACLLMVIVEVVLQLVSHRLYINCSLPNPPQLLWYHYLFIQNVCRQSSTVTKRRIEIREKPSRQVCLSLLSGHKTWHPNDIRCNSHPLPSMDQTFIQYTSSLSTKTSSLPHHYALRVGGYLCSRARLRCRRSNHTVLDCPAERPCYGE